MKTPNQTAMMAVLVAIASVLLAASGVAVIRLVGGHGSETLDFAGEDRVLTSETDLLPGGDTGWVATSGTLFVRDGAGWTGVPDDGEPDGSEEGPTGSAVFRVVSKRDDLRDVTFAADIRLDGFTTTDRTPSHDWDGIHLFLRYQSDDHLYVISVNRRDDTVAIKKRLPEDAGADAGYHTLAQVEHDAPEQSWSRVRVSAVDETDGTVRLRLEIDGALVLSAVDAGSTGPAITEPGRIGIRIDNAEASIDEVRVTPGGG